MLELPLLFAVPLFLLYFTRERREFNGAVALSAVFTVVLTALLYLAGGGTTFEGVLGSLVMPFLMTAPLFLLNLPLKLRYRIVLVGMVPALLLLPMILSAGIREELVEMVYSLVNTFASEVYTAAGMPFTPDTSDSLFTYMMTVLLNGYCLSFVCIYLVNWYLAGLLSRFRRRYLPDSFYPEGFYNSRWLAIPLGVGVAGIIAGLVLNSAVVSVISWNLALCTAVLFVVQGVGIVRCMIRRFVPQTGLFRFLLPLLFVLAVIRFFPFMVSCLVLIAVMELWVPIRQRVIETEK
jgi:hypothetical protein